MDTEEIVNVNIGVLGHVDSGKTSFCAAVSTVLSTAALDKSPQSQARGITQDLQFSAFRVTKAVITKDPNGEIAGASPASNSSISDAPSKNIVFNFTLVDCPGHASLIRTIIGGASIIDMVILLIDVTKGIQTQTAESIIIAELVTKDIVVVLNKLDLLPTEGREDRVNLLKTRIGKLLANNGFRRIEFVPFCAKAGLIEGLEYLKEVLSRTDIPQRLHVNDPVLVSVDHCFSIKGQGSVATGTVLRGTLQNNQIIEHVGHYSTHKVKSMQVFKQKVPVVRQGERVGILLPSLDFSLLERGLLAHPGSVAFSDGLIATLNPIRYYKGSIETNMKIHISIGHSTVLGTVTLFNNTAHSGKPTDAHSSSNANVGTESKRWELDGEHELLKVLDSTQMTPCFALLHLEKQIPVPSHSIYIASKLDADVNTPSCRLAFHGEVLASFSSPKSSDPQKASSSATSSSSSTSSSPSLLKLNPGDKTSQSLPYIPLTQLKIYTTKLKTGAIDRVVDDYTLIGKNLFKKETKMSLFIGLKVQVGDHSGVIDSSFGSSGKFKVKFSNPVAHSIPHTSQILLNLKKYKFTI